MTKKINFINLVNDIFDFELFDKNGKQQQLPLKVRPETPGSEQWIRITNAEEARQFLPAPRWNDANRLDELALFVHISNSRFAHVKKYASIRDKIIEHYQEKGIWHKVLNNQDLRPSEAKEKGVFEIVFLIRVVLREDVKFNFNTGEVSYEPIALKTLEEYSNYKVDELREECRTFKLSAIGNKEDLLNTLKKKIKAEIISTEKPLNKMSRDELRKECANKNLSQAGTKEELLTRLQNI